MTVKQSIFKLRLSLHKFRNEVLLVLRVLVVVASLVSLGLVAYRVGFTVEETSGYSLSTLLLLFFFFIFTLRIFLRFNELWHERGKWLEFLLYACLFIVLLASYPMQWMWGEAHPLLVFIEKYSVEYIVLVFVSVIELSRRIFKLFDKPVNPGMLFAVSFMLIILLGASLLMLPNATYQGIGFIDALFTSTSAVCVTGLVVVDTATYFTPLGQTIIIILIQIGGIGVMTFTSFFAMFFVGTHSFNNRVALRDMVSDNNLNKIFKTIIYIILVTISIEAIGALFIYVSIHGTLGMTAWEEFCFSVFHAVSAFCNAGFSTLSGNMYDPLVRTNYSLHTWVSFLIVFGGLGFPILFNYGRLLSHFVGNKFRQLVGRQKVYVHARIINTNTRLAIRTTILLLVFGTLLFYLLEYNNTLKGLSPTGKLAEAFFGAVTPRTAGFNSVDLAAMLKPTVFLTIVLMWIGASPMSTGGGIKTTTFAIVMLNLKNALRSKHHVEVDGREISSASMQRSVAIIILSLIWLFISITLVSLFDPHASLDGVIFECVSALSTVGLSLNLTPTLSDASRVVLLITMFVGRVGLFTILTSLATKFDKKGYHFPKDNVMVG